MTRMPKVSLMSRRAPGTLHALFCTTPGLHEVDAELRVADPTVLLFINSKYGPQICARICLFLIWVEFKVWARTLRWHVMGMQSFQIRTHGFDSRTLMLSYLTADCRLDVAVKCMTYIRLAGVAVSDLWN